jgi:hypothetical protein
VVVTPFDFTYWPNRRNAIWRLVYFVLWTDSGRTTAEECAAAWVYLDDIISRMVRVDAV